MSIQVKDFNWSQTSEQVVIRVPLKGVNSKRIDVFSTNEYVKVSYPPYIFEAFLYKPIIDSKSKGVINNGLLVLKFDKEQHEKWPGLNCDEINDKKALKMKRENAINYAHQRSTQTDVKRNELTSSQKKFTVEQQMSLENDEKQKIKAIQDKQQEQIAREIKTISENGQQKSNKEAFAQDLSHTEEIKSTEITEEIFKTKNEAHQNGQPRQSRTINVNFTKRQFATPARESKHPEEEAWLEKVSKMNKIKDCDRIDCVDVDEMNPIWLKDKGNKFYQNKNYIAAINAYTAGLVLNDKIPSLYSNRAACHLHMKQYSECVQDCSSALELFDPPVPDNLRGRCRALSRRSSANYQLKRYDQALVDLNQVLELDPSNEEVKKDVDDLKTFLNVSSN